MSAVSDNYCNFTVTIPKTSRQVPPRSRYSLYSHISVYNRPQIGKKTTTEVFQLFHNFKEQVHSRRQSSPVFSFDIFAIAGEIVRRGHQSECCKRWCCNQISIGPRCGRDWQEDCWTLWRRWRSNGLQLCACLLFHG